MSGRTKRQRRARAVMMRESWRQSGLFMRAERMIGSDDRRRVRRVIIGITGPHGGISALPRNAIAFRLRNALGRSPLGVVTIYDAQGRAIAMMDPLTRQRRPIQQ